MKDIELVDILFQYMYNNNELLYYERALSEAGVDDRLITLQLVFKLNKLLKASGFVEEINKMVENHPVGLKLNNEGVNMLLEYGSYENYLKEKRKEKKQDFDYKRLKINQLKVSIFIALVTAISTILLSDILKWIYKLLLKIFQ